MCFLYQAIQYYQHITLQSIANTKKIRILYCHHCWWKQFTTLNTTISNNNYIGECCSCKSRYDEEIVYICENEREIFYPCSYCNLLNDGVHTYHSQCVDDTVFEFTPFVSCPKQLFFTNMNKVNTITCQACNKKRVQAINHGCIWMCEECKNQTLYFELSLTTKTSSSTTPSLVPFTIRKPPSMDRNNRSVVWSCYFCKTNYIDIFDDKVAIDRVFKCTHCHTPS